MTLHKGARCLVTGDTGFIGSAFCKNRITNGYDILGLSRSPNGLFNHVQCDLVKDDFSKIESIVKVYKPDAIFHFAANPLVKNSNHSISEDILASHKLLDACPEDCKFIFASSATVYGRHSTPRGTFRQCHPISTYGIGKKTVEDIITLYVEKYKKIKVAAILRFCGHVGVGNNHGVCYDIIQKLKGPSQYLELLGKRPGSKKQFLHIDDSIEAITKLKYNKQGLTVKNIAPITTTTTGQWGYKTYDHHLLTVLQVANIIMQELGIYKKIKWNPGANWVGDQNYTAIFSTVEHPIRTSEQAIKDYVNAIK